MCLSLLKCLLHVNPAGSLAWQHGENPSAVLTSSSTFTFCAVLRPWQQRGCSDVVPRLRSLHSFTGGDALVQEHCIKEVTLLSISLCGGDVPFITPGVEGLCCLAPSAAIEPLLAETEVTDCVRYATKGEIGIHDGIITSLRVRHIFKWYLNRAILLTNGLCILLWPSSECIFCHVPGLLKTWWKPPQILNLCPSLPFW